MKTLYLRNVPEELSEALEELAAKESMSVNALAVRELTAAVAYRANADLVWESPNLNVDLPVIVDAVRSGRDT
ncbi:MAG TPA: antitoxin [Tessaracoccus flavescens]|uniref:Antitoxin n=1 Tax=Tessaracoccus flavescens TaxID=399497 RepID=A0A921EPL3_9ACTN|nr:antitoxin [Tessaracoccus flavescens]